MELPADETLLSGESGPSPVRWLVAVHAVLLVAAICLANNLPSNTIVAAVREGIIVSQVALFLIWLVLISSGRINAPQFLIGLCVCVGPVVVLALPLVLARGKGMRVRWFSSENTPPFRPLQFSMSQIMGVMSVMALLFALGQLSPANGTHDASGRDVLETTFAVIGTVVVGLACVAVVLTIPLVCVWAVLSPGTVFPRLAVAFVGWLLGATLVVHVAGGALSGPGAVMGAAGMGALILLATLAVLRTLGYRAIWQVDPRMSSSPTCAASRPMSNDLAGRDDPEYP